MKMKTLRSLSLALVLLLCSFSAVAEDASLHALGLQLSPAEGQTLTLIGAEAPKDGVPYAYLEDAEGNRLNLVPLLDPAFGGLAISEMSTVSQQDLADRILLGSAAVRPLTDAQPVTTPLRYGDATYLSITGTRADGTEAELLFLSLPQMGLCFSLDREDRAPVDPEQGSVLAATLATLVITGEIDPSLLPTVAPLAAEAEAEATAQPEAE